MTDPVLVEKSGAMTITAPGVYSGIPMDRYLADPCVVPSLNASTAVTLLRQSPLHAWANHPRHPAPLPRDDNKAADIGTVAHALLLEKDDTKLCVIDPKDHPAKGTGNIPDGWTNTSIRAARDAARDRGLVPMLPDDAKRCLAMRDQALNFLAECKKNPRGRPVALAFENGESEAVAVAQEGPTWLRCRPDWLTNDRSVVVHLKTTARSAEPNSFIRGLLPSMGYDLTLAFYARVIAAAAGVVPNVHCILAQEQDPPYACSLIGLNPEYAAMMDERIERAVRTWAACMKSGNWPGYPTEICFAEPRPWQIADAEEEAIQGLLGKPDPAQLEHGVQA